MHLIYQDLVDRELKIISKGYPLTTDPAFVRNTQTHSKKINTAIRICPNRPIVQRAPRNKSTKTQ